MTQTRGLVTWLNSLHWACHSSYCLCYFGGFLSPPSSSHLLSFHLFLSHLLTRWWRCVSQVAHSSKHKGSGSLFQTKTSHSLLSKGKDVDEDLPRRICPPHCPPKAVSAPCRQREMSIKRGHEVCWKGHQVVVISAIVFLSWMEKTIQCVQLTSLWTNSPFRYTERKI